jgi:hypothetical protein
MITIQHGHREDPLRPQVFDPADVEIVDFMDTTPPHFAPSQLPASLPADIVKEIFEADLEFFRARREAWEARNLELFGHRFPKKQCDHCGAHIRWAYVIKYLPTGQHFVVGQVCGETRMTLTTRRAFEITQMKKRAEAAAKRAKVLELKAKWMADASDEARWLAAYVQREGYAGFFGDLAGQLQHRGYLSEKQTACVTRQIAKDAETARRRAEESAALVDTPEIQAGRYTVTGEVVHTRTRETDYGIEHKMLLKAENGNKYWVSIPKAMLDMEMNSRNGGTHFEIKGSRVAINATWEASHDDPHFGFGRRPTLKK